MNIVKIHSYNSTIHFVQSDNMAIVNRSYTQIKIITYQMLFQVGTEKLLNIQITLFLPLFPFKNPMTLSN